MKIENIIRRILREDTANPYYSALRRVMFDDDDIKLHLRKYVFGFQTHKKVADDEFIERASNHAAYEVLEPGLLHMSDEDIHIALDELTRRIKEKYSDFIKEYKAEVFKNDDDETYCFRKHSDRYMDMKKNTGFGDCVTGWIPFLSQYGGWFPDLDWNEIKEKISSEPNKYLLIKKPLEGHNFEYYFSVLKKTNN
jgi:hypothetical protein